MSQTPIARVLIVDDDQEHAATLLRLLQREGYEAAAVLGAADALRALSCAPWDVVLTDLVMPDRSGLELLADIRERGFDVRVILMTAFGTVEKAVEAMKAGAFDFVVKPIRRVPLLHSIEMACERNRLQRENRSLRAELDRARGTSAILGDSPALRRALALVRQAASSDATILLLGESGTGKELFAREIHSRSSRSAGPLVALHCAALPESIIESELFGHEAGAFTGATRRTRGRFEAAHGGTLFLDEIGELPLSVQVKLLRVLQEGEIMRVGGSEPVRVDVRIVAATHRDLAQMVEEGTFREDLFYRLHVIAVPIPALRERPEDIQLLVIHFVRHFAATNSRPLPDITPAAMERLSRHEWPGNVRQLQNAIERAVVLDRDGRIDLDDLPDRIAAPDTRQAPDADVRLPVGTSLAEAERRLILATLQHTGGDKNQTAAILGVGRRTIYRRLDEYDGIPE